MKKNNESMSKFDKLVEVAKIQMEERILEDAKIFDFVYLHSDVEDLIMDLGGDWYYELLLGVGYSATTIYRKMKNFDFEKLASKLEIWYKTELLPKLCKRFETENKTIKFIKN